MKRKFLLDGIHIIHVFLWFSFNPNTASHSIRLQHWNMLLEINTFKYLYYPNLSALSHMGFHPALAIKVRNRNTQKNVLQQLILGSWSLYKSEMNISFVFSWQHTSFLGMMKKAWKLQDEFIGTSLWVFLNGVNGEAS